MQAAAPPRPPLAAAGPAGQLLVRDPPPGGASAGASLRGSTSSGDVLWRAGDSSGSDGDGEPVPVEALVQQLVATADDAGAAAALLDQLAHPAVPAGMVLHCDAWPAAAAALPAWLRGRGGPGVAAAAQRLLVEHLAPELLDCSPDPLAGLLAALLAPERAGGAGAERAAACDAAPWPGDVVQLVLVGLHRLGRQWHFLEPRHAEQLCAALADALAAALARRGPGVALLAEQLLLAEPRLGWWHRLSANAKSGPGLRAAAAQRGLLARLARLAAAGPPAAPPAPRDCLAAHCLAALVGAPSGRAALAAADAGLPAAAAAWLARCNRVEVAQLSDAFESLPAAAQQRRRGAGAMRALAGRGAAQRPVALPPGGAPVHVRLAPHLAHPAAAWRGAGGSSGSSGGHAPAAGCGAAPRARGACRAAGPGAQPPPDWSAGLLSLTKKKRKRARGDRAEEGVEVAFSPDDGDDEPWPGEGPSTSGRGGMVDDDDDDDGGDGGRGGGMMVERKRLPAAVRCFDTARIFAKSGDGGAGCVAFRREPYVEKGGPNGGNGGRGGHVWAVAEEGLNSLLSFRGQAHFRAGSGFAGQGSFRDGGDGSDLDIRVPVGTIIRRKDADEGEPPLAELLEPGQRVLLLVGGRGGRGNMSFKTRLNTAPTIAEKGEAGREEWLDLELKVVADVGIVGVPNAGKSTLLGVLSAARPKVANYPFTTLTPNLGVCEMDYRTTVFADVPGLLEGAHEGHGLGHAFLRHISRCRVLLHLLDGTSPDPIGDYKAIQLELELFNPALLDKPQVVAYNKVDLPDSGDYWEFVREYLVDEEGVPPERLFPISALTGRGVREVVAGVRGVLDELGPARVAPETNALNLTSVPRRFAPEARIDKFTIESDPALLPGGTRLFVVRGDAVERFAQMTNWDYYEAVKRFQRVLEVSGINEALVAAGCARGDTVALGDVGEFVWSDDRSEAATYGAWLEDMDSRGRARQGSSKWPTPR
ncbi:OBGC1 [Scenedesmus sp. PABB004]|nr:OBGC1 [Scenedesmus sp. PABB004]